MTMSMDSSKIWYASLEFCMESNIEYGSLDF